LIALNAEAVEKFQRLDWTRMVTQSMTYGKPVVIAIAEKSAPIAKSDQQSVKSTINVSQN
jgi:hypothetical protein